MVPPAGVEPATSALSERRPYHPGPDGSCGGCRSRTCSGVTRRRLSGPQPFRSANPPAACCRVCSGGVEPPCRPRHRILSAACIPGSITSTWSSAVSNRARKACKAILCTGTYPGTGRRRLGSAAHRVHAGPNTGRRWRGRPRAVSPTRMARTPAGSGGFEPPRAGSEPTMLPGYISSQGGRREVAPAGRAAPGARSPGALVAASRGLRVGMVERPRGVEPRSRPWQGHALPLCYSRMRAIGRTRTGDLGRTRTALFLVSYDGVPRAGLEPATTEV